MKQVSVTGLVRSKHDEGRPVFAVLEGGRIQHIGYTSSGYREYSVPDDAVAIAFPLWGNRDGYIFVHEAVDGAPERGHVATWQHKRGFDVALASLLGVDVQAEAVRELMKRIAKFIR